MEFPTAPFTVPSYSPMIGVPSLMIDPPLSSAQLSTTNKPSKKRERQTKACSACRLIKRKCDGAAPCSRCVERGIAHCCVYVARRKRSKVPRVSEMEGVSSHMQLGNSGPSTSRLSVQDQSAHDPPSSHSDDSTLSDSDCEEAVLQPVAHSASHRAHPASSFPVANSAAHHAHSHTVVQAGPTSPDPSHHFDFLDAVNFLSHQSTTSSPYFTFDLLPTVSMVSVHASVASNSAMTQHTSAPALAIPSNALVDPSARFENFVMELDPRLARFNSFRFIRRILQRRTPEDVIVQAVQNMMESIKNDRPFFESMLNFDLRSAVARDVVVRHQVEDAEVYVQASKFPSMMVVFSGRLHKYNSAFVEISSFSREDLDRAEFEPLEVFEEVSIPIILNSAMKMRANRKLTTNSIVTVLRRKDGRRVEYCTGITYVRDSLGNLLSSVMTFIPMPEADTM